MTPSPSSSPPSLRETILTRLPLSLLSVEQERDETLRTSIDRFGKAALRVKNLTQDVVLQCMALALKPGPFVDNIFLRPPPPTTMHKLKLPTADHICMKEMKMLWTKLQTDLQPMGRKVEKVFVRANPRPRDPKSPRYSHYAPLSASRSCILDKALQTDLIPPLQKALNPPNADMSKYCKYHRNNGHTMDECKALQDKIKELIRVGHLKWFIRSDKGSSRSRYGRESNRPNHQPSNKSI